MRSLIGLALLATATSVLAAPRIYPAKKAGDYIVQVTEIETDRHNMWLVRIEDPARGVVCYMQLGDNMSCVRVTDAAPASRPPTAEAQQSSPQQ